MIKLAHLYENLSNARTNSISVRFNWIKPGINLFDFNLTRTLIQLLRSSIKLVRTLNELVSAQIQLKLAPLSFCSKYLNVC